MVSIPDFAAGQNRGSVLKGCGNYHKLRWRNSKKVVHGALSVVLIGLGRLEYWQYAARGNWDHSISERNRHWVNYRERSFVCYFGQTTFLHVE